MTKKRHEPARKDADFLTSVARSIGSTLGAVAAKVSTRPARSRHKRAPAKASATRARRAATRNKGRRPKNRKKS